MKTKHIILEKLNVIQQSTWIRPALVMLALIIAALGVAGCKAHH